MLFLKSHVIVKYGNTVIIIFKLKKIENNTHPPTVQYIACPRHMGSKGDPQSILDFLGFDL